MSEAVYPQVTEPCRTPMRSVRSASTIPVAWKEWHGLSTRTRLRRAWQGINGLLGELAHRGVVARVVAAALAPVALAYVIGSVLRDRVRAAGDIPRARRPKDADAYLRHRYGGAQRLVNWRERRLVRTALGRIGASRLRVLDVPSGYGRFGDDLRPIAAGPVVCADIDRLRLGALRRRAHAAGAVHVVQADLQKTLPFASGTFDLVFNLRYLHHVDTKEERRHAVAELARVSRRYLVLSYYRGSNLHALQRKVQSVTRGNRRRSPAMMEHAELRRLLRDIGWRMVSDAALLPGVHAQRLVLLERPTARAR